MSSITIGGRRYDAKELVNETQSFTDDLAKKIRLDRHLDADVDLTESEDKEAQAQLRAMVAMPPEVLRLMLAAFCARHLVSMAKSLRTLSLEKQPKVFATYIQIISLLPEARSEPYWRAFLCSPDSEGIPNIVGNAFAKGVEWRRPSGPGLICGSIIELLFWGNTDEGDDKKAAMDSEIRKGVMRKTRALKSSDAFRQLDTRQQAEIERLNGILGVIEDMPADSYLASTRSSLEAETEDQCGNEDCDEEPTMRCVRCKIVEYCGSRCQAKHWKKEHKVRCFERLT